MKFTIEMTNIPDNRRNMVLIISIVLGLVLGFLIKRVSIGLLIGIVLGLLIMGSLRKR